MSTVYAMCMALPEATPAVNHHPYFYTACEQPAIVGRGTNQNQVATRASTLVVFALGRRRCTLTVTGLPMLHARYRPS